MSVLYLVSSGCVAYRDHGRVVIRKDGVKIADVPIGQVQSIVVSEHAHISLPTLFNFLANGRQISFIDSFGRLQGTLGQEMLSLERMEAQKAAMENNGLYWVRYLLQEKFKAQESLLRSYAKRKKDMELSDSAARIKTYRRSLLDHEDIDELRGIEGAASRVYFSCFPFIIDQSVWNWQGRNRRPPRDGLNALLSYGYTLLERDVRIAIAGAGLDARIGALHRISGRRDALVYDLMEPFRPAVIDRYVLKIANLGIFSPASFEKKDDACLLKLSAKKEWFQHFEEYMAKPSQKFQGQSPRDWMRTQIERFGILLFEGAPPAS